jgi:hypothetical protein
MSEFDSKSEVENDAREAVAEADAANPMVMPNTVTPDSSTLAPVLSTRVPLDYALGSLRDRKYARHPLSALFPQMGAAEFRELVACIRLDGLLEPVVIYQDAILDGYHRDEACFGAGVTPRYVEFEQVCEGLDVVAFVTSKNLLRRQMTASQRALTVASLATMGHGGYRNGAGRKRVESTVGVDQCVLLPLDSPQSQTGTTPMTLSAAAHLAGVSQSTVSHAKKLLASQDDEVICAVRNGQISLASGIYLGTLSGTERSEQLVAFKEGGIQMPDIKQRRKEQRALIKLAKNRSSDDLSGVVAGEPTLATLERLNNLLIYCRGLVINGLKNDLEIAKFAQVLSSCKGFIEAYEKQRGVVPVD